MGHYMDIQFEAHLNDLGMKLITDLYDTKSWLEVCKLNNTLHPSILAGVNDDLNVIPFSGPANKKSKPSSFDPELRIWTVNNSFKWKFSVDDVIARILENIISEPVQVSVYHDLWDNEKHMNIVPNNKWNE